MTEQDMSDAPSREILPAVQRMFTEMTNAELQALVARPYMLAGYASAQEISNGQAAERELKRRLA